MFPTLEEDMRAQPKRIYTYRDLLELFETSTKRHATRVAMRIERDGRKEQYTYADLRELATRAAGFLASEGIKPGDRVMLVSHNAPEWGMTYFGVLKTGASCIPVDPESSTRRDRQLRARRRSRRDCSQREARSRNIRSCASD